jgi:hypothetical protein
MNPVKLVAVFVENKPGETARITRILAEARVNIRWVTIANTGKFGVMKFLVDQCDIAVQALRQKGLTASLVEVLALEVKDQPGALHGVAEALARVGINVENISGFVANRRAVLVAELADVPRARALFEKQGLPILGEEQMLSL